MGVIRVTLKTTAAGFGQTHPAQSRKKKKNLDPIRRERENFIGWWIVTGTSSFLFKGVKIEGKVRNQSPEIRYRQVLPYLSLPPLGSPLCLSCVPPQGSGAPCHAALVWVAFCLSPSMRHLPAKFLLREKISAPPPPDTLPEPKLLLSMFGSADTKEVLMKQELFTHLK